MRAPLLWLALLVSAVAAGCGSSRTSAPAPTMPVIVKAIHVDSIQILLDGPPSARVRGVIGDGCTELSGRSESRSGNRITITIYAQRPAEAVCIQIARLYDEVLRLPGEFPRGDYVLAVNGVETAFAIR